MKKLILVACETDAAGLTASRYRKKAVNWSVVPRIGEMVDPGYGSYCRVSQLFHDMKSTVSSIEVHLEVPVHEFSERILQDPEWKPE